jgi:broad specificity phosphatase PhoE
MLLYLVRHGQSVWNAEKRHQGWQNVPLSPLGEKQAESIGQRLKNLKFDYHFTSPIKRCYDTASAIVRAQDLDPAQVLTIDEDIKEARLSARLEGLAEKELRKDWTEEEKRRFSEDYTFRFEDGESVQGVIERTLRFFQRVAELSEEPPPESKEGEEPPKFVQKTALIVAHNIHVQILALHALDALDAVVRRQDNIDRLYIGNCALTVIETNLKGKRPHYRALTIGDSSHTAGIKVSEEPKAEG